MGLCVYCDEPAGFFRSSHAECRESHSEGVAQIARTVADVNLTDGDVAGKVESLVQKHRVRGARLDDALADAWAACVESQLATGVLDRAEEGRLEAILARFGKRRQDVDRQNLWRRVAEARVKTAEPRLARLLREAVTAREDVEDDGLPLARPLAEVEAEIEMVAAQIGIADVDVRAILLRAVEAEVERVLDDELLTVAEERAIVAVAKHFDIGQPSWIATVPGRGWSRPRSCATSPRAWCRSAWNPPGACRSACRRRKP